MKAQTLLKRAFVDLDSITKKLHPIERKVLAEELEQIAKRAGQMAAYMDERHGYGCGDQGHSKAVKELNRAGKTIWTKAFGYNAYHDIRF